MTLLAAILMQPTTAMSGSSLCTIKIDEGKSVSSISPLFSGTKYALGSQRETQITISPVDDRLLLISASEEGFGSILEPGKGPLEMSGRLDVLYRSSDHGKTWQRVELPKESGSENYSGGDPIVIFSKYGKAYYKTMMYPRGYYTNDHHNVIYRSDDGGRNWVANHARHMGDIDHAMMAADLSNSPYAGRVYALGIGGDLESKESKEYYLVLYYSKDNGKTYIRRNTVSGSQINNIIGEQYWIGVQSDDVFISRSGKLFMAFRSWNAEDSSQGKMRWLTTSVDGGKTNGQPFLVTKTDGPIPIGIGLPDYAIDMTSGPFSNRIYMSYPFENKKDGSSAIYLTHSDDEGQTWANPLKIEDGDTVMPALTVNNRGVLFISWYRSHKPTQSHQLRYMTASLDGGRSVMKPVPLDSKPGASAGDYVNTVAGKDGALHAAWPSDGRIIYASAQALCNGKPAKAQAPAK